jgi:hypothetical protein
MMFAAFPTGPFTSVAGVVSGVGSALSCRLCRLLFGKVGVRGTIAAGLAAWLLFYPVRINCERKKTPAAVVARWFSSFV